MHTRTFFTAVMFQLHKCIPYSVVRRVYVSYLSAAGFPFFPRNILDLDDLGAHELTLLPMPHEIHLTERPHPQYLQPLVSFHLFLWLLLLALLLCSSLVCLAASNKLQQERRSPHYFQPFPDMGWTINDDGVTFFVGLAYFGECSAGFGNTALGPAGCTEVYSRPDAPKEFLSYAAKASAWRAMGDGCTLHTFTLYFMHFGRTPLRCFADSFTHAAEFVDQ